MFYISLLILLLSFISLTSKAEQKLQGVISLNYFSLYIYKTFEQANGK